MLIDAKKLNNWLPGLLGDQLYNMTSATNI
jgi:hypothetical protein